MAAEELVELEVAEDCTPAAVVELLVLVVSVFEPETLP